MRLAELVRGLDVIEVIGAVDAVDAVDAVGGFSLEITDVCRDHRLCVPGSLFVCIEGFMSDGHEYIEGAIRNGAVALVVQKNINELKADWEQKANDAIGADAGIAASKVGSAVGESAGMDGITVIRCANTRHALAQLSANFFRHPSQKLKIAGITGTKGKTTITYMIRSIVQAEGLTSGIIGTVENLVGNERLHSQVTTPESYDLQKILSYMVEKGVDIAAVEVSSQGLALDRASCCDFNIGVFTNLYKDHISTNEHSDMEDYFSSKLKLFEMCETGLVNTDFNDADRVIKSSRCKMLTFGIDNDADIMAKNIETVLTNDELSVSFDLVSPWFSERLKVGLPGRYNVYNALAAIGVCSLFGLSPESIAAGLRSVKVRGRVEMVKAGQGFFVLVDYAHNAASLESLLEMLREYKAKRIITVFGCGGDRSKDRRFDMGEVSGRLSDLTIITSDNPRTEKPLSIIENIEEGIRRTEGDYRKIADRKEAIQYALKAAEVGDIVVIAGKGHETTQVFSNRTVHFDDVETAYEILRGMDL